MRRTGRVSPDRFRIRSGASGTAVRQQAERFDVDHHLAVADVRMSAGGRLRPAAADADAAAHRDAADIVQVGLPDPPGDLDHRGRLVLDLGEQFLRRRHLEPPAFLDPADRLAGRRGAAQERAVVRAARNLDPDLVFRKRFLLRVETSRQEPRNGDDKGNPHPTSVARPLTSFQARCYFLVNAERGGVRMFATTMTSAAAVLLCAQFGWAQTPAPSHKPLPDDESSVTAPAVAAPS